MLLINMLQSYTSITNVYSIIELKDNESFQEKFWSSFRGTDKLRICVFHPILKSKNPIHVIFKTLRTRYTEHFPNTQFNPSSQSICFVFILNWVLNWKFVRTDNRLFRTRLISDLIYAQKDGHLHNCHGRQLFLKFWSISYVLPEFIFILFERIPQCIRYWSNGSRKKGMATAYHCSHHSFQMGE